MKKENNTLVLLSPAKINLFLHILNRRVDGYHNLQTLFQLLNYGDELSFTVRTDTQINLLTPLQDVSWQSNLIYKAAKLLQETSGTSLGVDIQLIKKIPMGAGLGGGSSNAATTLRALNQLWQLDYEHEQLAELSLQLGADVPVFVQGHTAWAEGVGEKITPIDLPGKWYVIITPPCHVSTREIFLHPQLTRNTPPITIERFKQEGGHNDMQSLVCQLYPEVAQALKWLSQFAKAQMTGSGSSIFAAFPTEQEAQSVKKQLPGVFTGFVAQGINTLP